MVCLCFLKHLYVTKIQVGNDQEKAQSEIPTPKAAVGKTKLTIRYLKESIRKRIYGPVHIHLDVTVRVTNQIPPIYPMISTQSSFENYAKMRLESRRLPPYLFTCDVTHSLSVESHLQAIVLHFILSIKFPH